MTGHSYVVPKDVRMHRKLKLMKRYWQIYVFLLVPVVWMIMFKYVPMYGNIIAFKDYTIKDGIWDSPWVGLKHFKKFMTGRMFGRVMKNTLTLSLYSISCFPHAIILALMLNALRSTRARKFSQTVMCMPHFISVVVMVGIILQVLDIRYGLLGRGYTMLTGEPAPNLIMNPNAFPHIYIWSGVWQGTGWGCLIYNAALSKVDPELHEAAIIDGASRLQRMRYIDIPTLLPMISILLIMRFGDVISIGFDKVYLLQNAGNAVTSEVLATYTYKQGMQVINNYSYSASVSMFQCAVNISMLVIVNWISRKVSSTSLF